MSIGRFRRQHEQLRQVIVRVLRPAVTSGTPGAFDSQSSTEPLAIEPADSNSIDVCIPQISYHCHLIHELSD